jgi:hypothetical protein
MAIINGAKSKEDVIRTVKAGFATVIKVCTLWAAHFHRFLSLTRLDHLDGIATVDDSCSEIYPRRGA